jgi:general nucleoside transport system ATP-binding protein
MPVAVRMTDVVKRFPLVLANDHVDFEVAWGEVHALIGENGAGKSTLMKVLYGLQTADAGTIEVDGRQVAMRSARDAIDLGIGMVHQHFMLVEPLTVAENLVLGAEPRQGPWIDMRAARHRARELIARFGFDLDPDARIDELPVGLQQQVEILKALFRDARILIMDEPTAVLTPQETRGLFTFLRDYAAAGHAVVFISHKLDEVMEICDRMSVMRDGRMVGTVPRAETDTRALASMMVGREVLLRVDKGPAQPGEVRLEARGLRLRHPVKARPILDGVDLAVRAGEIVGIAGIEGNGQTELVEVLTGLRSADAGTVSLAGEDVTALGARARREAGVSHVPEDRNERGLVRPFTAAWNAVLGDHHRAPYADRLGLLDLNAIDDHAREIIEGYDVRPRSTTVMASSYSGGNAQKLIMARELERAPRVLVAAQPTRGVDIGAIEFIHRRIVAARDAGLAVLLVSADLNEVMSLSDRILVMFEGRVMGELAQAEATAERLGLLMAGAEAPGAEPAARPLPPP